MPGLMEPSPRKRYPVRSRDSGPVSVPVERIDNRNAKCDTGRCGSNAKFEVVVVLDNIAKSLFFCGHHFRKYRLALAEYGYEVKDI